MKNLFKAVFSNKLAEKIWQKKEERKQKYITSHKGSGMSFVNNLKTSQILMGRTRMGMTVYPSFLIKNAKGKIIFTKEEWNERSFT